MTAEARTEPDAAPHASVKIVTRPASATDVVRRTQRRPRGTTIAVFASVLVISGALSYFAHAANRMSERRILRQQLAQAAGSLNTAVAGIQSSLTAASAAATAPTAVNSAAFGRIVTPLVGPGHQFASVALWAPSSDQPLVTLGVPPKLLDWPAERRASLLRRASTSPKLITAAMFGSRDARIAYAIAAASDSDQLIAYAESALPRVRTRATQRSDAFASVDFALYFGPNERRSKLIFASRPELPLAGDQQFRDLPFGSTTLRLVFVPRTPLAGWLSANLVWIVAGLGALLALISAVVIEHVSRRRDDAAALAVDNARLYQEQQEVAVKLQRSLLPRSFPGLEMFDVAARYEPATSRTEVGGDWFDVFPIAPGSRVFLTIGDVSGHGIPAAATMASLRFAARAYAAENHSPGPILSKLTQLVDIDRDEQFATVLCAVLDLDARTLTVASAGHPQLLLCADDVATFVDTSPGPPVGLARGDRYVETTVDVGVRGRLVAFTDGLFERRDESLDVGLERVRRMAETDRRSLDEYIEAIVVGASSADHDDDLAIMVVAWGAPEPTVGPVVT